VVTGRHLAACERGWFTPVPGSVVLYLLAAAWLVVSLSCRLVAAAIFCAGAPCGCDVAGVRLVRLPVGCVGGMAVLLGVAEPFVAAA